MARDQFERGVLMLFALMLIVGSLGYMFYGGGTEYVYEVKAEQVNENEMVNESVEYDTLSEQEREMLFKAFKKSDHFLGGAEAHVAYDEPVEGIETDEWKIVRVKGVPILVAISEPMERNKLTPWHFLSMLAASLGIIIFIIALDPRT